MAEKDSTTERDEQPKASARRNPASHKLGEKTAGQKKDGATAKELDEPTPLYDRTKLDETKAATRQHPSLWGQSDREVTERTIDATGGEDDASGEHVKDFVLLKREWDAADQEGIHARNINAVRQFMVNQGLRPDADVTFTGAEDHPDGYSVILRYAVGSVPAAVASAFDQRHTVIHQDGPTATELADYEGNRDARIRDAFEARR